ncbi:MAG: urease accessory protein UreF [Gammaproteobacteria bacterium]|nr:urease accessory protein UreF [Gammaproteobacteria bacterium]
MADTNITTINTGAQPALWRLLQLVSPNLPIGAFAYSQGLEQAVDSGRVTDEAATYEWLSGVLSHSFASLEIPLLSHCYRAWQLGDESSVSYWNDFLLASRETAELHEEERLLGINLARLLADLGIDEARPWSQQSQTTLINMFALAAVKWQIPMAQAAQGLVWSWLENQIAAAIKLVPLGQTAGQRLYMQLTPDLEQAVNQGLAIEDEADIGQSAFGVALASSWHETQYSRLFRS